MKNKKIIYIIIFLTILAVSTSYLIKGQADTIGGCGYNVSSDLFDEDNKIILLLNDTEPNWETAIKVESNCMNISSLKSDNVNMTVVGKYYLQVLIFDDNQNSKSINYEVHVRVNTTPPVITGVNNQTFVINSNLTPDKLLEGVKAVDDIDGEVTNNIRIDTSKLDVTKIGTYDVTYSVVDSHGNKNKVTVKITIIDNVPPVINNTNMTLEVYSPMPEWFNIANVTDNVDPNPKIYCDSSAVRMYELGTYDVKYTAIDNSGNKAEKIIKVNVVDTTTPEVTVDNPVFKVFSNKPNWLNFATVKDNYDTNLSIVIDDSLVKLNIVGTYDVKYTVTDHSNNQSVVIMKVHVIDVVKPILHGLHNFEHRIGSGTPDWLDVIYATDNYEGLIDKSRIIVDDSFVKINQEGRYPLKYTVSDLNGNEVSESVYVSVYDTIKPEINGPDEITLYTFEKEYDFRKDYKAEDNVSGDITDWLVIDSRSVNFNVPGTYKLYIHVSDLSGNMATKEVVVTIIKDSVAPVISGVEDESFEFGSEGVIDYLNNVVATDDVSEDVTLTVDDSLVNLEVVGPYKVTYIATDESGNETRVQINVNVVDTVKPVIDGTKNISIKVGTKYDLVKGITATDNYDGDITDKITIHGDYNLNKAGKYNIILKVTDSSGNEANATYVLTVTNNYNVLWLYALILIIISGGVTFLYFKLRRKV